MIIKFLKRVLDDSGRKATARAFKKSFSASVVLPHGRDEAKYFENGKCMTVYVELGAKGRSLYASSIRQWEGEFASKPISDKHKRHILSAIVKFYGGSGKVKVADPQPWCFVDGKIV